MRRAILILNLTRISGDFEPYLALFPRRQIVFLCRPPGKLSTKIRALFSCRPSQMWCRSSSRTEESRTRWPRTSVKRSSTRLDPHAADVPAWRPARLRRGPGMAPGAPPAGASGGRRGTGRGRERRPVQRRGGARLVSSEPWREPKVLGGRAPRRLRACRHVLAAPPAPRVQSALRQAPMQTIL